jgi:hypothetical protein
MFFFIVVASSSNALRTSRAGRDRRRSRQLRANVDAVRRRPEPAVLPRACSPRYDASDGAS